MCVHACQIATSLAAKTFVYRGMIQLFCCATCVQFVADVSLVVDNEMPLSEGSLFWWVCLECFVLI